MSIIKYFFVLIFFTTSFAQDFDAAKKINENPVKSYPIDGSYLLAEKNKMVYEYFRNNPDALNKAKLNKNQAWNFTVGYDTTFYARNFTNSTFYSTSFTCRAVGINCYIFVEDSLWTSRVDQAAVDSVKNAFDLKTPANPNKGIYQMDVDAFGNPPNIDGDPKIVILILNIRDGYSGSGGYIAGYFDSYNEITDTTQAPKSNRGEFYYIDANPLNLKTSYGLQTGMATAAHEFQHMINFNYHTTRSQLTFINESCSKLAELWCGYPADNQSGYANETNYYLFGWRDYDNTLVLNDYSRAQKFSWYLWDQFGIGIFKFIVQSSLDTIPLYNKALQLIGSSLTFNDVFKNWLIANSLNDISVNRSYGYAFPNITKSKAINYYNPIASGGNTMDNLAAEYLTFSNGTDLKITFNSGNSNIVVKAIKLGSTKEVVDVPLNFLFSIPDFGTTYTTVTFVVMNVDPSNDLSYTFTSTGTITSAGTEQVIELTPSDFSLSQNYPNPFNPTTVINYSIAKSEFVSLKIYDLLGNEVATLVNEEKPAGNYNVDFQAHYFNLSSGTYFYRLQAGNFVETKKMILLK